ncbi:hypothetical protein CF54_29120 [Streptomyces sp. Tu 6176]|uniref:hypothetical protein n=1 Tax=Streptomyces sp. Tu 6176 TaxID=1470557 RepID=UPI000449C141|nr:hypothetical protein [Streptomyces sp. Tu 6176]EYT79826.1 hypothetical protein CF54_29120 [Streptomyces sp. Tu 6176]
MNGDSACTAEGLLRRHDEVIRQHDNPLLRSARSGRVEQTHLLRMVQADLWCMEAETVAYAVLLARFPNGPAGDLFAELNSTLRTLRPRLDTCARALGPLSGEASAFPEDDGAFAFAFPAAVSWMSLHAERAAAALALRSDFAIYARECRELVHTLADTATPVPEAFRDYYDMPAPVKLLDLAAATVEDGLRHGDAPGRADSTTRLLVSGLDGFWRFAAGLRPSSAAGSAPAPAPAPEGSRTCA